MFFLLSAGAGCRPAADTDFQAHVRYVIDGDTVVLDDGRRIRLIGMDTPELARDDRPAEPLAAEARQALEALIAPHGNHVLGEYDAQRKDPYDRTLAHLFTPNGRNLTEALLRRGLATLVVIPPNVRHVSAYLDAEREARAARRGLWRLPAFQPVEARDLPRKAKGFHVVRGTVTRIGHGRRSLWIEFGKRFSVRIDKDDLPWFDAVVPDRLKGRRIEVRGLIWPHKGRLRMRLRHPALLQILD